MSDNIHDFEAKRAARRSGGASGSGGDGQPPDLGSRVGNLEASVADIRSSLRNLELSAAETRAVLASLATKADIERNAGDAKRLDESIKGLSSRVGLVESGLRAVEAKVDAKLVSGAQMFGIFSGLFILFLTLTTALVSALRYFNMLR